jgi:hypothetical protein
MATVEPVYDDAHRPQDRMEGTRQSQLPAYDGTQTESAQTTLFQPGSEANTRVSSLLRKGITMTDSCVASWRPQQWRRLRLPSRSA